MSLREEIIFDIEYDKVIRNILVALKSGADNKLGIPVPVTKKEKIWPRDFLLSSKQVVSTNFFSMFYLVQYIKLMWKTTVTWKKVIK